jgi:DNA-binding response OmpR family regulator
MALELSKDRQSGVPDFYAQSMRILVVEDEPAIADFVRRGLDAAGYAVTCVGDGDDGLAVALSGQVDLVLLDLMLPGRDGLDVLDAIRAEQPQLPVIIVTAKAAIDDRVAGLDRGADDYLVKPFAVDELLARIRANLRGDRQRSATVIEAGDLTLDVRTRHVDFQGRGVRLTTREFELLAYLMRHPNQVLSRSQLLNAVWGYDYEPGTNVVEVYVNYLRKKLRGDDGPAPIETVRGAGYRLMAPDE